MLVRGWWRPRTASIHPRNQSIVIISDDNLCADSSFSYVNVVERNKEIVRIIICIIVRFSRQVVWSTDVRTVHAYDRSTSMLRSLVMRYSKSAPCVSFISLNHYHKHRLMLSTKSNMVYNCTGAKKRGLETFLQWKRWFAEEKYIKNKGNLIKRSKQPIFLSKSVIVILNSYTNPLQAETLIKGSFPT